MARKYPTTIGETFHYLTVIGDASSVKGHKHVMCKCTCGTEKSISYYLLRNGKSRSCGCMSVTLSIEGQAKNRKSSNTVDGSRWIVDGDNAYFYDEDKVVIVSSECVQTVSKYRWYVHRYVTGIIPGQSKFVALHRLIIGARSECIVDHINRDTLDNRKENLRACSHSENAKNRSKNEKSLCDFKGVHRTLDGKWYSQIKADGKRFHLGTFNNPVEAALAYDESARSLHGKFAATNFDNYQGDQ